jgi:HEAT repeat protein
MLAIGCQQAGISSNTPAFAANATNGASAEAKPDEQLDINKNALLEGPSEEIRIKAATVMLGSENPLARKILIDALMQTKNSAARVAVCKALIQTRSSDGDIKNKEDFIQPLFSVFATDVAAESQLAAEATLIYEYDKIGKSLEGIVTDASKLVKTRINAIHALKLWPDMEATIRLIRLVDDPEKQVSAEAEKALHSLGIPVGENYWTREQNIIELRSKGKDEFLRDWLIRQEAQMRKMRVELNSWQSRYQSALGKIYDGISDDGARGKFLAEHLGSSEAVIKLWALDKVHQWRVASGTSKLPTDELEPILVNLISDPDRDVRLKTAGLSSLRVMNSAQQLLTQLESEPDEQVKVELLDALGGACSFALLASSPVNISSEIRKEALELAAKYLSEEDAGKARKGAEVIRKLLEPEGLKPEELDGYLGLLVKRYNEQKKKPDGALRGELLSAMAGLCTQGSAAKAKAATLFGSLFIEALSDETDFVRETAVDGLIYIDKASALKRLRKDFVNDPSEILRKKLIDLAGEIGGKEDLTWLAEKIGEKIGSNSESGPAWQAMIKIFDGCDSGILNEWMDKLTSQSSKIKLSEEQKIAFLKKAEAKAQSENRTEMLKDVREKLAELYKRIGQFERAAEYLDRLYKAARTTKEREAILPNLLDVYLRSSKLDLAVKLVGTCLAKEDLGPDNAVLVSINNYLSKPPPGANPNAVFKALSGMELSGARPKWQEWLKNWTDRLGKSKETEKPKEAIKAKEK